MSEKYKKAKLHVTKWPGDADVPSGCSIGIDDEEGAAGGRYYYLFTAVHGDPDELAANAQRMVACWNACEGISTEQLERDASSLLPWLEKKRSDAIDMAVRNLELKDQRNELLEIARLLIDANCPEAIAFATQRAQTAVARHDK